VRCTGIRRSQETREVLSGRSVVNIVEWHLVACSLVGGIAVEYAHAS